MCSARPYSRPRRRARLALYTAQRGSHSAGQHLVGCYCRELAPEVTHGRARGALRADAGPAAMRCRRGARRRGLVGRGRSQCAVFVSARRVGAFRAGPGGAVQPAESLPGMAAPAEARTRGRRRRRGAARHGEWHGDPGRSRVRRQRHLAPVPERLSQRLLGPRPRCGARARASRRGRATAGVGGSAQIKFRGASPPTATS